MYHTIIIVGNLGRDPEMRYLPSGQPVTNFSVATSHKYTNRDDQLVDETTWFRISVWGRQAASWSPSGTVESRVPANLTRARVLFSFPGCKWGGSGRSRHVRGGCFFYSESRRPS